MSLPDPASLYPAHLQVLSERADEALARGGFAHLVVPSGRLHYQAFDDRDYPFAVNPQFKAWLPLTDVPDSWVVYTPGRRPRLIYCQPHDYWNPVPQSPAGWWLEHFDVDIIRTPEEALPLLPSAPARCAILGEANSALGDWTPNNPDAVLAYLDYHRACKTPYELALMRQAQALAVRGHRAAEAAFRAGRSEFEIHLAYCEAVGQDVNALPYGNIVAFDRHAAVLHYTDMQRQRPSDTGSMLIDAGASRAGYAADITRTHASEGAADFQALIDAVDAAQQRLCAAVRPGFDYRRLHLDAHLALAGVLHEAGVLKVGPEQALASGVSAAFFPHGIGHLLGLQVHDVGGFAASDRGGRIERPQGHPYLRLTRPLQPGMVVTIEPGLYFVDMLLEPIRQSPQANQVDWGRVAQLHRYGGIRIEDNVLCTESAPENLTRPAFAAV